MATEDIYILGIYMTKFGNRPDVDTIGLAAEAALAALSDADVTMADMGVLAAGNLMAASTKQFIGRKPDAAAGASQKDVHGLGLHKFVIPAKAGMTKSGELGDLVREVVRGGAEVGHLLAELAETLLDAVDVLGDILRIGADGGDGRGH